MSRTKESRKEVLESGSPLSGHSLNQGRIKIGDEGAVRLVHTLMIGLPVSQTPIADKETAIDIPVPLTTRFIDQLSSFILQLANRRTQEEENLPIDRRIVNSATDVNSIFKEAMRLGVHTQIVDPLDSGDFIFPLRDNTSRYREFFPYQFFTARIRQLPSWRFWPENVKTILSTTLPIAYMVNLTSTDFTLQGKDLIADRIATYGFTIATLGRATHLFVEREARAKEFFPLFSDTIRKYFKK